MHPYNSTFFELVLPEFLSTTRKLFLKYSLFIQLQDVKILDGTVTVPISSTNEDHFERSQTLVKYIDNGTFSATAVQCYRATTKRFDIEFCENEHINHPIVLKIAEILKILEENVTMFRIEETMMLVRIVANEDTVTSESNLTLIIAEVLQLLLDLSKPIKSIQEINYPVICFGTIKLLVAKKNNVASIEIYNHFDTLCGKWSDIQLCTDKSTEYPTNKNGKALTYESPTLKCMRKIGITCSESDRHETFTSLGLDSLKTSELEMKLQAEYPSYRIPYGITDRCCSVAEMDAYLLSRSDMFDVNKDTTVYSNSIPLSPQQKRIIFMLQLEPTSSAQFNEVMAFSMNREHFDNERLKVALNSVVMRHSILRTVYLTNNQYVYSGTESFLAMLNHDADLQEFVSFPIDISEFCLEFFINRTNNQIIICLLVHHIAVDGHSISIITEEIESIYSKQEPLQSNPRQYADYCLLISSLTYENQLAEWSKKLKGREFQLLPTDKPRTNRKTFNGASVQRRIPKNLHLSLKKLRKISNCTNFCIFIAIYKFLIYKTVGIADFPVARKDDVPFDVLVNHLNIDRDDSLLPIFQVLLVMDNVRTPSTDHDIVLLDIPNRFAKYEQTWYFQDYGNSINIRVEYNCDLFRYESISEQLDRFMHILNNFGKYSTNRLLKNITIITNDELKTLVEARNTNVSDIPQSTMLQIFQKNLHTKSSINFKRQRLDYSELNDKSCHMSAEIFRTYCSHYGELPQRDRCAVVYMRRCLELLITIIGIWKCGLTAVPINSDWPLNRILDMLKSFENPILIENHSEQLKAQSLLKNIPVITPRNIQPIMMTSFNVTDLSDMAYITCTSGTTGTPKAVCTEFYGHSNLSTAYTRKFLIHQNSHTYQVVNYGFDIFFADLSKTFANGASMTLADTLIPKLDEMNGVTNAYIMPIYLSSLSIMDIKCMSFMESIHFGGETIQASALKHLLETDVSVYQEHGVTEQTVYSTCTRMDVCSPITEIGNPYHNIHISLRDLDSHLLPTKYQSVYYFGGCGIFRGYYNDSNLTANSIYNGIFGKEFRTGDVVKSVHGRIQFVGRIDLQYHIGQHDDVEANIVAVDENEGTKELVAYVIFKSSKGTIDDLRDFLTVVYQNGKIERSKLPKPQRSSSPINLRKPATELEVAVINSFRKYTGKDHMMNNSFFENGGDSVKAMLVVQDLAAQGFNIDLKSFFSLRTAEKIVLFLEKNSNRSPPLVNSSEAQNFNIPLSAQQKRLWFLSKMHPNWDSYVIRLHVKFVGILNLKKFQHSFNLVVISHPILRSVVSFVMEDPVFTRLSGTECFHMLMQNDIGNPQIDRMSSLVVGQLSEEDGYKLDLRIHHIISDGKSLAIIGEQLAEAYNNGEIVCEDRIPQNKEYRDSLPFWEEYLKSYEHMRIEDKGETDVIEGQAGYLHEELSYINNHRLHDFCSKYGCTLYHIVVLSFVNALRMAYDLEDVVVGTTIANRSPSNMRQVGLFANTIPLRFKDELIDFEEQLRYTIDQILSAMEYQSTSLAAIVEQVVNYRDAKFSPLFQHVVTFESTSLTTFPYMNGLQSTVVDVPSKFAQFDQSWIFHPGKLLTLSIQYNRSRCSLSAIKKLLKLFNKTLWNILEHNSLVSIRQSPERILRADIPQNKCLGKIFSEQTRSIPHNICFEGKTGTISYIEALNKAENLSKKMQNVMLEIHGLVVTADDVICLILNESTENQIAIEAVHLLGCAYLSVSTDTPIERLRYILTDCQSKLIVAQSELENLPAPILMYKKLNEKTSSRRPPFRSCSNDLAYVVYTSGTTGIPKGVCVTHRSILNMLEHATLHYYFHPMNRVLQFTKSSFDASISNTFGCLLNGGILSIRNEEEEIVHDLLHRQPIAVLHMTPILLDMFDEDDLNQLSDVERWSVGGETMSGYTMNAMIDKGYRLIQLYGPTECTCYITLVEMKKATKTTCLGPAISNISYGFCSFTNHLIKRQSQGQLYCSGESLARGYIGRIQKGFVVNSCRTTEDKVLNRYRDMYLTGDEVVSDHNRYLHFLGRKDDQVKIKGCRIQLSEIENIAQNVDGVQNVAAVLQTDKANSNHIVMFYTGTASDILLHLKERLHNYMLPTKILRLAEFPRTSNGKINRAALSSRNDINDDSMISDRPSDKIEENVLNCYQKVLKQPNLHTQSNFFQAGGHSLLVIRLIDALQKAINISVPILKVFELPVVADLAEWIKISQQSLSITSIREEQFSVMNDIPTPLQIVLLRSFRNSQLRKRYDIPLSITLRKPIPIRKQLDVVNSLAMIHPSLRTRFVKVRNNYSKTVLSGTECYQNLIPQKTNTGIDPLEKPPFLVYSSGISLQMIINHIITDGHSMQLLVKNLERLLNGERISMDDSHLFHCWLLNKFQQCKADDCRYWKCYLENIVYNQLPTAYPRLVINDIQATSLLFPLSQIRVKLSQMARTYDCTPFVVMLSLFSRALQSISYDPTLPIAMGFPVNHRTHELQNSVGYGISTVMVAHDTNDTAENVMRSMSIEVAKAMSHAFLPYDEFVELSPSKKLFSVMLVLDDYSLEENDIFRVSQSVESVTKFELSLFVDYGNDCIRVEYNTKLYDENFIRDIIRILNNVVLDWYDIPKSSFESEEKNLIRTGNVIYNTIDIYHHLEYLALMELHIEVSTSDNSLILFYCSDTNKEEIIRDALKQLPEPLRPMQIVYERKEVLNFPLSTQQMQMYYLSHENPSFYVLPFLKKFPKNTSTINIHYALLYEIQRHESLRTIFFEIQGEPRQSVLSMTEAFVGLRIRKTTDIKKSILEFIELPLNLLEGVPFQAVLFHTSDFLVALLKLHHIISDAWSSSILEKEMEEILTKLNASEIPVFKRQASSYKDFCLKKETALTDINSDYINALTEAHSIPETSLCHDDVEVTTFDFSEDIARSWMKRYGVSFFVVVLGFISECIIDEFEMSSVNIGSVSAGRSSKSKNIFGYFLNNLVFHIRRNVELTSLQTLAKHVSDVISMNIPYAELISIVRQRCRNLQPLFQVYFNCRYDMEIHKDDDSFIKSLLPIKAEFPLEIDLDKDSKSYYITIRVTTTLPKTLGKSLMNAIKSKLQIGFDHSPKPIKNSFTTTYLLDVIKEKAGRVLGLNSIDPNENFFSLGGNSLQAIAFVEQIEETTVLPKNSNKQFHESLEALDKTVRDNAVETPSVINSENEYCQMTGETVRADTIIPVLGQRSISTILSCLSVIAAGCAYLPMDYHWPPEKVLTLLRESHASCYIGPNIADINLPNISIRSPSTKARRLFGFDTADDLAYVICTSGTTGIPKIACISRGSVINMILSSTIDFRLRLEDVTYQFTMLIYDNSVLEIFMTLANGAQLIVPEDVQFTPRIFTELISIHGITHCLLFPGVVSTFNEANFKRLSLLRYWIVGAEKLPQKLLDRAICEGVNVIQNYGPTETTAYALTKHMKRMDHSQNIGRAILNTDISLGKESELLIKGKGIMRGYLNQQNISFSGKERWYSTGDHVQMLPNGDVLFVGRIDSQVKIRGHRVELGEIESTITSLDDVPQCKVVWRADDEKLIAFCTRKFESNFDEQDVLEKCREHLPIYVCPTHVIFLENFPLTKNSKIDVEFLSRNWKKLHMKSSFLQLMGNVLERKVCSSSTLLENGGSTKDAIALKALYFSKFGRHLNIPRMMRFPLEDVVEDDESDNANAICQTEKYELLHRRLRKVWSKVLKHENFENNDHFFFCGGAKSAERLRRRRQRRAQHYTPRSIGASIGGTIAIEMSKCVRRKCDVILIDSGTNYEILRHYKFDEHCKSANEMLSMYELDDETKFWMVVNSWDLLQLLKDHTLTSSKNLNTLTVFSVDGSDLGWNRIHPTVTRKIDGTHIDMLSSKHSNSLAAEIVKILSL
ncbi:AMP-binding enzyme [Dictyocaulus viviparus]|uniref:AMP-binding enzyme n=1 Tax=Dictyocaulus viviparus TaxID=29172 RepID=A0A0D8XVM1_DICVI|nr:AMP-binding enzyme [Dictyocaulus viviparus]